ncbi:mannitol dehydrogenase family protein [Aureimonas pseudogalii]|uniref:mannitol dehydrogenase family protein n=1 Tax=Aureimonas pseudogalii TaxID=1744844 RepID=UPI00160649C5|nr:mannitol dehydrogenase family protein [Aureimonas pseudogalii]
MPSAQPASAILQFGTSRFLLAHADLFVSQALERGDAIGRITVVQTTDSAESALRVEALSLGQPYPVHIRGLVGERTVDDVVEGRAVLRAYSARRDWNAVRREAMTVEVIISNTGDRGFCLDPADTADSVADRSRPPRSFPAKIAALLLERFETVPQTSLSLFPCELVSGNGDKLRTLVRDLATAWNAPPAFFDFLSARCRFANSLVDRIVSEPLQPVGAVAEPYALWAIEAQEGLVLPCRHPAIVVTDDLARYEQLKLHILNLGHTVLADLWISGGRPARETVREAMADPSVRRTLETVWEREVVPVFAAQGLGLEAELYVEETRQRFLNPFLAHRLSDIAGNHAEKKVRRLQPIVERSLLLAEPIHQPILTSMTNRRS